MKIEMGKTYRTRDGRPVRLLCVDGPYHDLPVVGVLDQHLSLWEASGRASGCADPLGSRDLTEIKPRIKREYWVNVYVDGTQLTAFRSKAEADARAGCGFPRRACVKVEIDCEEGEGL